MAYYGPVWSVPMKCCCSGLQGVFCGLIGVDSVADLQSVAVSPRPAVLFSDLLVSVCVRRGFSEAGEITRQLRWRVKVQWRTD